MEDYNFNVYNEKLYKSQYHFEDISKFKFLITGGAGFIGSNIVEYLLKNNAGHVRVLDNLSNGYFENIHGFSEHPNFEFINGDIRELETCERAIEGIDFISHQAALGSVPRSISDPITSNDVNVTGFLNLLTAVKNSKNIKRMVYAASSSTYGDSVNLPKIEGHEGSPLSPYAVTKLVNELYAEVYSKTYNLHTIGLRYFNIFGPKQNPNNPYAAVIPIFCKAFISDMPPIINGDGNTSRDFTFVENAVQANIKAMLSTNITKHEVMNVACGGQVSLNEIIFLLNKISNKNIIPIYKAERQGDVKHSKASIEKIIDLLNYKPTINFEEGLRNVYDWYLGNKF
jgi:UDP-N-acetylglucosamine 4-epimerase